jgi:hypothetical protein
MIKLLYDSLFIVASSAASTMVFLAFPHFFLGYNGANLQHGSPFFYLSKDISLGPLDSCAGLGH